MGAEPRHEAAPAAGHADPIHMVSGPGVTWSRVNLSEALPGVLTPLGWTFWADATETSARLIFWRLGWAPAMLLAAALVIDVGGALSHGAIVARELGVPA